MTNRGTAIRTAPMVSGFKLDDEGRAILCTLLYYHIFRFPLTATEIQRFSRCPFASTAEVEQSLERLVNSSLVGHLGPYYFVGDPADVDARVEAEDRARAILPRAQARSRLIAHFPFIRAVTVSGTLSKGVMKPGDDLDFMVFTEPGRLWISRFLLMAFKKIFLFNSHRNFCVNYLLTTDHLAIPDHDLFTATEIAWLLPTSNRAIYDSFIEHNRWVEDVFPNWSSTTTPVSPAPLSAIRRWSEQLLDAIGGDRLDAACQNLFTRRNRRKHAAMSEQVFESALRASRSSSKHHPQAFRDRTLASYTESLRAFEEEHNVVLDEPEAIWD